MNDCDYWMASSLKDAVDDYSSYTGEPVEDIMSGNPIKLLESELRILDFYDDPLSQYTPSRSFYDELQRQIRKGTKTGPFATTEW